jgi:hypothetical protein
VKREWTMVIAVLVLLSALACSFSLDLGTGETPAAGTPVLLPTLQPTLPQATPLPTEAYTPLPMPTAAPSPALSPSPTVPNWPLVLADDFDDPTSGFGENRTDDYRTYYDNGSYTIEILREDWVAWSSRGSVSDFVAELDVISHGEAGGAGLIFRYQDAGRQFYLFAIDVDGRYWLRMLTSDGWRVIRDWQESPYIRTGASANRLKVVCQGAEISLYVNDQYLETVQDTTFAEGAVGMLAGTSVGESYARFSFDNLRVYGPAAGRVLFRDDFSDPSSGWLTRSDDEGEVRYENGELYIRDYTVPDTVTASRPGQEFSDLIMEVEARLVGGTEDNWLGHYCRYVDADNFYVMAYSSDGYYTGFGLANGERTQFAEPTRSDAIRQGPGVTNVARLECIGSSLRFWVNGELLIDVVDTGLAQGDIALDAESQDGEYTEVAYDNLIVTAP